MPAGKPRNRQPGIPFDAAAFLATLPANAVFLQKIVPFDHQHVAVTSHRVAWTDEAGACWQLNFELYNGRAAFALWPAIADHSARRPVKDLVKWRLDLDRKGYMLANPPAEPEPATPEPAEPVAEPKRRGRRPKAEPAPATIPLPRVRRPRTKKEAQA